MRKGLLALAALAALAAGCSGGASSEDKAASADASKAGTPAPTNLKGGAQAPAKMDTGP